MSALEVACPKDEVELKLDRMLACDFVLGNFDRHYNNFGLVRDARTLEFRGFAPIFDSGNSLWCDRAYLEDPVEFAYEALPFAYRGDVTRVPDPKRQLHMLGDWRWYEEGMFDDAPEVVFETLSMDENLPPARIDRVVAQVRRNVETLALSVPNAPWRGRCSDRMRAAGKAIDSVPAVAGVPSYS